MHGFGNIRQIAYLTNNIEASMNAWMANSNLGPFTWYKNLTLPCDYQGQIHNIIMDVGIAFRGDMQIELIQQTNDVPSPYRAFFENNQMGLHHLAYVTDNMDAAITKAKSQGFNIIATIDAAVGRYAYFQDPAMPESIFEFLEVPVDLAQFWEDSIDAAKNWSGDKTIQEIDMTGV